MAGNVLSGGTDVVASTIETPSSAIKTLGVSVVMAAAIFSGQDARAAEIGANMTEAKNACMAESKANWSKLLVLAEKKREAGDIAKADELVAKHGEKMIEADKTCETLVTAKTTVAKNEASIAKNEASIAKNEAKITQFTEVIDTGKAFNQEIQARLALVDNFSEGNTAKVNDTVAFLNRGREFIAKARAAHTDTGSLAQLAQLEANINLLASRLTPGSGVQIAATR